MLPNYEDFGRVPDSHDMTDSLFRVALKARPHAANLTLASRILILKGGCVVARRLCRSGLRRLRIKVTRIHLMSRLRPLFI
jgi:hypothetical protein